MALDLDGRRVLVVGASSGIGREIGLQLASAGARVAFSARRVEALASAVSAASAVGSAGGEAIAVPCDVRDPAGCEAVVAETVAAFGGLDALVFATAIDPLIALREAGAEVWTDVLATNVVGASLVMRAALEPLVASALGGRAVFLSATSVGRPLPGMGVYETSKAALEELVRAWRAEHPEIGFSTVAVGNTLGTDVMRTWDGDLLMALAATWDQRGYVHDNGPGSLTVAEAAGAVLTVLTSPADLRHLTVNPPPGAGMDR